MKTKDVLNVFGTLTLADHDFALNQVKVLGEPGLDGHTPDHRFIVFDNGEIILRESIYDANNSVEEELELTKRLLGTALSFINEMCEIKRPENPFDF